MLQNLTRLLVAESKLKSGNLFQVELEKNLIAFKVFIHLYVIWGRGTFLCSKGIVGSMSGDCSLSYLWMTLKKLASRELGLGDM